ncbi:MAG: hypothetical protein ACK55I_22370, partial [bacterium]
VRLAFVVAGRHELLAAVAGLTRTDAAGGHRGLLGRAIHVGSSLLIEDSGSVDFGFAAAYGVLVNRGVRLSARLARWSKRFRAVRRRPVNFRREPRRSHRHYPQAATMARATRRRVSSV